MRAVAARKQSAPRYFSPSPRFRDFLALVSGFLLSQHYRHDQHTATTPSRLQHLQIAKSKVRWPAAVLRSVPDSRTGLLLSKAPRKPGESVCLPRRSLMRASYANRMMQGRSRTGKCEWASRLPHRAAFQAAQATAGQCAGFARGLAISVTGNSVYHACSRARRRLHPGSHSARTSERSRWCHHIAAHLLQLTSPIHGRSSCLFRADPWLLPHPAVGFYRRLSSPLGRALDALVSELLGSTSGGNRWCRARPNLRRPILRSSSRIAPCRPCRMHIDEHSMSCFIEHLLLLPS